jgi:hypothetical protein
MEKIVCSKCGADNATKAKYCSGCGFELPKIQIEDSNDNEIKKDSSSNSNNIKKIIGITAGVIISYAAYFGVQQLIFKSSSIDKGMMNVASELNKTCPIMIDSETRLDNAVALPDNVFQYNYSLVTIEKSKVDTLRIKKYLEPNIINSVKSSPQMQYQRNHKWTLNYYYRDKSGLYLFLIKISPDKYEK